MKKIFGFVFVVMALASATAQIRSTQSTWKATLRVIDETARPVSHAEIRVSFSIASAEGLPVHTNIVGFSDTDGNFVATHTDPSVYLGFRAEKASHYSTSLQHLIGLSPQDQPNRLNPAATLILKKIIKPIPMHAKWITAGPPVLDEPVGYDLMVGDWVAPHGKGESKDFMILRAGSVKSSSDYESKLVVTFPNPGDGIYEAAATPSLEWGSGLRSSHEAPEGGYQTNLTREIHAHPGQPSKFDYDEKRNYFFRVRTVLDERGNVKSALYGKIYGDFMQFRYYLNPTPNDRNVEFDPKRNLLQGLKPNEQVDKP